MHSSAIMFPLFTVLLLTVGISIATPIVSQEQMVGHAISSPEMQKTAATCYDPILASIINQGLANYKNNMQKLAQHILNQIQKVRRGSSWLVHAEMIGRQQPHVEWESVTNGDIFDTASPNGCYYHDGITYIVALRYY